MAATSAAPTCAGPASMVLTSVVPPPQTIARGTLPGGTVVRRAPGKGVRRAGAKLRGADLAGVNLVRADLRVADLSRANLSGAKVPARPSS